MIFTTGAFVAAWLSLAIGLLMMFLGAWDKNVFVFASGLGSLGYSIFIGTIAEISRSLQK